MWQDIASLYRELVIFSYTYPLSDKFPIAPSWMLETKRLFAVKRSGSLQWASPREYSCCRKTSFVERSHGRHLQTRMQGRVYSSELHAERMFINPNRNVQGVYGCEVKTHKHYFIGKINLQSTAIFRDCLRDCIAFPIIIFPTRYSIKFTGQYYEKDQCSLKRSMRSQYFKIFRIVSAVEYLNGANNSIEASSLDIVQTP